ncbi:hypothetical protein CC86DRAFT_90332 [Ophiobolus disseminans]|uniref:Ecp2 effector protein domain-containing protein n=1 Tax=Ophiobolus disseminans TaxID=1469910 RepID=A0A6A7AHS1_9PLEO|nr:hypothetical protein CC86DRAFT_90332 [Ophiobolus disseminans]
MYATLVLSTLVANSLAAPLAQTTTPDSWKIATDSTVNCDKTSEYTIGGNQGILLDTLLTNACTAMIPCAYATRPESLICTLATDISLKEQKTTTQHANVLYKGNKQSGWDAKFTVTPPTQPSDLGARWAKEDCYGYFAHVLDKWEPEGCHTNQGMGIGSITVGSESPLKGTVFEVAIVKRQ